jgi:hypothetical protein
MKLAQSRRNCSFCTVRGCGGCEPLPSVCFASFAFFSVIGRLRAVVVEERAGIDSRP